MQKDSFWKFLLGTFLLAFVTSACAGIEVVDEPESTVSGFVEAQVTHVVDGDTIHVLIDGTEYRVRYIGIDTPEINHPTHGVEPFGPEASQANSELVERKTVRLEKDVSETDKYGRLLRYVYIDDLMVNEELLRRGLARVATFPPDVKYADRFLETQRAAQEAGVGMWGSDSDTAAPTPAPTSRTVHAIQLSPPGVVAGVALTNR